MPGRFVDEVRAETNARLVSLFERKLACAPAPLLVECVRDLVMRGGKRLRPALCVAAFRSVGGTDARIYDVAYALELLQAYLLIQDDWMDDDDVRRGGPIVKRLAETWIHARIQTDERKTLSFYVHPDLRRHDGGRSYVRGLRTGVEWRPLPSVQISMEPRYERKVTDAQWVDAIAATDGAHYVYGELDSRTLDLTTRTELSFAPGLSLELYLQPFIAIGDFGDFKELTAAQSYNFSPYVLDENRDFHRRSLKSNLVLRWEFSPGSALFVVWSQSRSARFDNPTGDDLAFRPFNRIGSSFSDDGDHVLLVKASYWVGG